jgi:hypothetical protein
LTAVAPRHGFYLEKPFRHDEVYSLTVYKVATESGDHFAKRLDKGTELDCAYCGSCKNRNYMCGESKVMISRYIQARSGVNVLNVSVATSVTW